MTAAILSLIALTGIPVEQMAQRVAERLQRLDRLVVEADVEVFTCSAANALDRSGWAPVGAGAVHPHRLRIVRPHVVSEFLTDRSDLGYEPVVEAVVDGKYIAHAVRPAPDGKTSWNVSPGAQSGTFSWSRVLQALDLHFGDTALPQTTLADLFARYPVELVGSDGDVSIYGATIPSNGLVAKIELHLRSDGTPVYTRTTAAYTRPGLQSATLEMWAQSFRTVNDAQLPDDVVVAVRNPNVGGHYGIQHVTIRAAAVDPALTADSLRITPPGANARVKEVLADGRHVTRTFEADGTLSRTQTTGGPAPIPDGVTFVPRDSVRWRTWVPAIAVAFGSSLAGLALWLARRPRGV